MSCWPIVLRKSEIPVSSSFKYVSGFSLSGWQLKTDRDRHFKTLVGEHRNWIFKEESQCDLSGWNWPLEIQWLFGFSQPG